MTRLRVGKDYDRCVVDKFSVSHAKMRDLAGRQTIRGLGLIDSRIDVLLKLDGCPVYRTSWWLTCLGNGRRILADTGFVCCMYGSTRRCHASDEMRSPPPDLIVNFSVWQA